MPTLDDIRAKLLGITPEVVPPSESNARARELLQRIRDRKAAETPQPVLPKLEEFPVLVGKDISEVTLRNRVVVQNSTETFYVMACRIPLGDHEIGWEDFIAEMATIQGLDPAVVREQVAEEFRGTILPGTDLAFLTRYDKTVGFSYEGRAWRTLENDPGNDCKVILGKSVEELLAEVRLWLGSDPLPDTAFVMKIENVTEYVVGEG